MQAVPVIERANLADDVAAAVRDLILAGEVRDGERLNEVRLAERLGVSRTPLREALQRLVSDGFVTQVPRRGFFVRPLLLDEAEQIYPIRAILDPEALALGGLPPAATIESLGRLNRRIVETGAPMDPIEVIALDEEWHRRLLGHCPNRVLVELIESFMARTRRYEVAYFRETEHVETAGEEHRRILESLEVGDLDAACRRLRQNLQTAVDPVLSWLGRRPSSGVLR